MIESLYSHSHPPRDSGWELFDYAGGLCFNYQYHLTVDLKLSVKLVREAKIKGTSCVLTNNFEINMGRKLPGCGLFTCLNLLTKKAWLAMEFPDKKVRLLLKFGLSPGPVGHDASLLAVQTKCHETCKSCLSGVHLAPHIYEQ